MDADAPLIVNVRGGARVCVPSRLREVITYVLLEQEDWFEDEIRFLRRWLAPGMHGVDVGANFGVYTVTMAASVGAQGRVWGFEPTPAAAGLLRRTLELNGLGQVTLVPAALSDRAGTVALALGEDSAQNRVIDAGAPAGRSIAVPAATLDRMAAEHVWRDVDFVKIDVEGHEPQVVAGGTDFFASHSPLVMLEVTAGGRHEARALERLEAMHYSFFRLIPGLLVLAPLDRQRPLDAYQLNLFACKPDTARNLAARGFLAAADAPATASPGDAAWRDYLRSAPYARGQENEWQLRSERLVPAGAAAYRDALAAFARSRDVAQGGAARLGWLRRAHQRVLEAIEQEGTLARVVSCARIAWELGLREQANGRLQQAIDRIEDGDAAAEPFLAPSPRYEGLATGAPVREWLACALREQREKLRVFSSLFGSAHTPALLGPILDRPYRSPESERRRQLVRILEGRQTNPEPHPLLCGASEENLNPALWCG